MPVCTHGMAPTKPLQAAEPAAPSIKRPELPPSDPLGVRNLARREFEKQHTQLNLFTQGVDSPKRYAKKRVDWDQYVNCTPHQLLYSQALTGTLPSSRSSPASRVPMCRRSPRPRARRGARTTMTP